MELEGKRVLITGASRGIGEAFARAFAGAGATVALVARTEEALQALAVELGGSAHVADLSDPPQVATLIHHIEDEVGPVDVLVNNAGIDSVGAFTDAPDDDLRRVTEVNYLAPAELCRQAIPRMLRRGGGYIVNVSSMAGCVALPGLVTYSASKAAVSHFTAGLRADLRGLPIRTTLVELGPVPTDLQAHTVNHAPTANSFRRFYRTQLIVDTARDKVAEQVVSAVRKNRNHVRLPKRAVVLPMLAEAPRRSVELLLIGVPHQAKQLSVVGEDTLQSVD